MADSVAFGGRFYRRRKDPPARASSAAATPVLISLNYDQGDVEGGGEQIILTGTNMLDVTSVSFGGTPCMVTSTTSSTATVILPAKIAGATTVTATNSAGPSNSLAFEFWAPTTDTSCVLVYDSLSTAYDGTTWVARYSANPGSNLGQNVGALGNVPASSGAPVFDGDQTTESGLRTASLLWSNILGTANGLSNQPGTIAAVLKSTNTQTLNAGVPYNNPQAVGNTDQGVIGLAFGRQGGVTPGFMGHVYSSADGYKTAFVAAAADTYHAVVSRSGTGVSSDSLDISLNGSLAGGLTSTPMLSGGVYNIYSVQTMTMGVYYSGTNPSFQTFAGTVRALVLLNAMASDTFITKHYKWAKQRHGVA